MRDEVDGSYYIESSQTKGNKITLIAQANSHNFCARLFWRKRKRGNVADASARVDVEWTRRRGSERGETDEDAEGETPSREFTRRAEREDEW